MPRQTDTLSLIAFFKTKESSKDFTVAREPLKYFLLKKYFKGFCLASSFWQILIFFKFRIHVARGHKLCAASRSRYTSFERSVFLIEKLIKICSKILCHYICNFCMASSFYYRVIPECSPHGHAGISSSLFLEIGGDARLKLSGMTKEGDEMLNKNSSA